MGLPASTIKTSARKVRVQAITGPIRAMSTVGGTKLSFRLLECTVDGKKSDGRDLTAEEAKQIKWVAREATSKPWGKSHKLVPGRELATGNGTTFDYISHLPSGHALVVQAYVASPSDKIAHWVKISSKPTYSASGGNHPALRTCPVIRGVEKLEGVSGSAGSSWGRRAGRLHTAQPRKGLHDALLRPHRERQD